MTIKTRILRIFFALLLCGLTYSQAFSQTDPTTPKSTGEWIRVQSENGEFSIEVPAEHTYFSDNDGFAVSAGNGSDIQLRNMRMLNAISGETLVSFEIYEAKKRALDKIFESDKGRKNVLRVNKVKDDDFESKEIEYKSDEASWVRRYFSSKTHIYVLTAGSRTTSAGVMKRFFDSIEFKPNADEKVSSGVSLSALRRLNVTIEQQDKNDDKKVNKPSQSDLSAQPMVLLSKPLASYINPARANMVTGDIRLKVTLSKDGSIPKVSVIETLPDGLLRQAVFAALRIKFLPRLKDGQPENSVVTVEYNFRIY